MPIGTRQSTMIYDMAIIEEKLERIPLDPPGADALAWDGYQTTSGRHSDRRSDTSIVREPSPYDHPENWVSRRQRIRPPVTPLPGADAAVEQQQQHQQQQQRRQQPSAHAAAVTAAPAPVSPITHADAKKPAGKD